MTAMPRHASRDVRPRARSAERRDAELVRLHIGRGAAEKASAGNPVLDSKELKAIGAKHGVSAAAVALSWAAQRGAITAPARAES